MNEDILNTIEVLTNKVRTKEEEANKLKKLVNELCAEAGVSVRFGDIAETGASLAGIRSDQFYGQTLPAAIRNYLERRKASGLGAATVSEIFSAIKDGGYKFETNNEDNAKTSVGNALRGASSIFHRLPNGQYGLLTWYPSAKAQPEGKSKVRFVFKKVTKRSAKMNGVSDAVTNKEIRDVVLAQEGEFQATDIEAAVKAKFPAKGLPKTKIPTVLFILKKGQGLIREISPRSGKKGAVYAKV